MPSGFPAAINPPAKPVSNTSVSRFNVLGTDSATGQSTLPSTCPVCEHSPVASEDCKPHKSLRTTIRVFLRTEEKKREALRLKEAKDTPPATPIESEAIQAAAPPHFSLKPPATIDAPVADVKSEPSPSADPVESGLANPEELARLQEAQQDIPQPSIEEIRPGQEPTSEGDINTAENDDTGEEAGRNDVTDIKTQPEGMSQMPAFGAGFGFDASAAGGFPGFGGDMSQMQMMMAMQNGITPNAFGNLPMMGMPGMNMDHMMMQNMFMNGGFGTGMGVNNMNSMSMGMGLGDFGGGVGGGFNNSWNGQQSWNVGQDNFKDPNAAGMGSGDYGANNSGYASQASGYNQGNYGHGNHHNEYQNNNFGYRGRGRGRGGYGRGSYGYGSHDFSQQYPQQFGAGNQYNGPISETGSVPTGPKVDPAPADNVDEFGREIRQTSEAKEAATESEVPKDDNTVAQTGVANSDEALANTDQPSTDFVAESADEFVPRPIQTLDEFEAPYAQTSSYNGYNNKYPGRGGFHNGSGSMHPPMKPLDVPLNAPTGPKAMRDGLPNTSIAHLRARGLITASPSPIVNGSTSVAPEPSIKDEKEMDRSRSPSRERSRSRSRDMRRSRSAERHRSHRHRHRSTSLSEDEKETERRRQRRKERRRRREEEEDEREDTGSGEKTLDQGTGEADQEISRSASPSTSKRSSHRSRRDKDKYRERERESDREHRSSHKHRSSHRSHRDDRSRSRDRDRDRDHRHRHSRRGSEAPEKKSDKVDSSVPPTPIELDDTSRRPSLISNGHHGIEIKGASIRRKNTLEDIIIPTGPRAARDRQQEKSSTTTRHREDEHQSSRHRDADKDKERERAKEKERPKSTPTTAPTGKNPHEEEREARNRERLLKEAQRMAGLTGLAAGTLKRSRDDAEDARRGKKKARRGGEESDEARIARLEAERESARW
ncbi:hypothetical protein D0Z07_6880 [Hyphodiscus hymeniophilus]|uniref:Uncharacterized protein n=1 Tax=Hyphodiscus hymeniophilus TaxID=353542 RepID=A0A9P6VGS9_9HELO|nr:hypothetical protein D0Z07_6880 [Hyphodiscus hymeniophilus]